MERSKRTIKITVIKMKTLHLNLKKKWFDMIASGEKKEEYREMTRYWKSRIENAYYRYNVETVTFSNGYAKDRRQMVVDISDFEFGKGKAEWGAKQGEQYYIIRLGDILSKNF